MGKDKSDKNKCKKKDPNTDDESPKSNKKVCNKNKIKNREDEDEDENEDIDDYNNKPIGREEAEGYYKYDYKINRNISKPIIPQLKAQSREEKAEHIYKYDYK